MKNNSLELEKLYIELQQCVLNHTDFLFTIFDISVYKIQRLPLTKISTDEFLSILSNLEDIIGNSNYNDELKDNLCVIINSYK